MKCSCDRNFCTLCCANNRRCPVLIVQCVYQNICIQYRTLCQTNHFGFYCYKLFVNWTIVSNNTVHYTVKLVSKQLSTTLTVVWFQPRCHKPDKSAFISFIYTGTFDIRVLVYYRLVHMTATHCIVKISRMNFHGQKIPHDIGGYVAFASFRFFPPSMPRSSADDVVLTLWESIRQ